jgi:hypothetical protein
MRVLKVEGILLATICVAVDPEKLFGKDIIKDNVSELAATRDQCRSAGSWD